MDGLGGVEIYDFVLLMRGNKFFGVVFYSSSMRRKSSLLDVFKEVDWKIID